jgi:hypothetical protein
MIKHDNTLKTGGMELELIIFSTCMAETYIPNAFEYMHPSYYSTIIPAKQAAFLAIYP